MLRSAQPTRRPPPSSDAPIPPAPTERDAQWAVLLGGRQALIRAGWGRRIRAWQAAAPEVQESFGFNKYWRSVFKRIGRLDLVDPRWLDELDALGATLKQLRWLAGPGDGHLPEKVARREALVRYLRDVDTGNPPAGGFEALMASQPKTGVGTRSQRKKRERKHGRGHGRG